MQEHAAGIDWEQLDMIADGYTPDFMDIFSEFQREVPDLLTAVLRARDEGRLDEVAHIAHQIKGSAANFGFLGLCSKATAIETAARAGNAGAMDALIAEARAGFEAAIAEFQSHKSGS